jgi:hypothetical protein
MPPTRYNELLRIAEFDERSLSSAPLSLIMEIRGHAARQRIQWAARGIQQALWTLKR